VNELRGGHGAVEPGKAAQTSMPSKSTCGAGASHPARRRRPENVFEAHRVQGGVRIEEGWKEYVTATWVEGEVFEMVFRDVQNSRSAKANGYYWGVVLEYIAKDTGHKPEAIHDAMCAMFLPDEHARVEFFNRMTGEKLEVDVDSRRTSKLNGMAFYDFVEDVRQWARDFLNVETPEPDPDYWRKRSKKESPADVMRREKGCAA
jgi:hypothetical protein